MKDKILTAVFGVPQERIDALREHNTRTENKDSVTRLCPMASHATGHCWRMCEICVHSDIDRQEFPCNECDNHFSMYKKKKQEVSNR